MKFRAIVLHPSTSSILLSQSIISSSTSSTSTSSILLSQSITSLSSSPESTSTPPYQPTPVVLEQISNKYNCILCGKWLKSKITLRNHENKYHKFNKIIPHFSVLSSSNDIEELKQCIIINIQKKLGFNRHHVGRNNLSIILNNYKWWEKKNNATGTISFVVMEDDGVVKPEIKFLWREIFLNNMKCGFCKVEFNVNSK
ncbi:1394_t:CDS:2, partial [Entrophospora sp. SA101]